MHRRPATSARALYRQQHASLLHSFAEELLQDERGGAGIDVERLVRENGFVDPLDGRDAGHARRLVARAIFAAAAIVDRDWNSWALLHDLSTAALMEEPRQNAERVATNAGVVLGDEPPEVHSLPGSGRFSSSGNALPRYRRRIVITAELRFRVKGTGERMA